MDEHLTQPPKGGDWIPARQNRGHTTYLARDTDASSRGGQDLRQFFSFLGRRRWTILVGFLLLFAAVTAVTFTLPATFVSTASFLLEQEQSSADVPAFSMLDLVGRVASRGTEIELIQSRRVLEPVVDELDLHVQFERENAELRPGDLLSSFNAGPDATPGVYAIQQSQEADSILVVASAEGAQLTSGQPGDIVNFAQSISLEMPSAPADSLRYFALHVIPFAKAVEDTHSRIGVDAVGQDADVLRLTCKGPTAREAQTLCALVTDGYLRLRAQLQRAEADAAADFLAEQSELVETRLRAAEDSLRFYAERTRTVALDTRVDEEVRQYATLSAQREQLRAEHAALDVLITEISAEGGGSDRYRDLASFPTFLAQDNGVVPTLVEELVQTESRRNDLAVRRSERDVEMVALDDRIASIEAQLYNISRGYERALSAQITSLDQAMQNSGASLARIPKYQVEIARLERNVSLLDELFSFLQTRLREAEVAQAVELPSVRVIDRASLPFEPASPKRLRNLGLGFVLASAFGLLLGLVRESVDTRFRERGDVQAAAGMPVLTMLPTLKRPNSPSADG